VQRVSVVGSSGSGKSTVGARLAAAIGVPFVELDAIVHQPDWVQLEREEFRRQVGSIVQQPGWVIDGNYSAVRDLVWEAADTVVWIDLPRSTVMRQLVWRTLRRGVRREELWNGNRESLSNLMSLDADRNVVLWSWRHHAQLAERYAQAMADPSWAHLTFVRVRGEDDVASLLDDATREGQRAARWAGDLRWRGGGGGRRRRW
jgi:adenylate kinase family enzyme